MLFTKIVCLSQPEVRPGVSTNHWISEDGWPHKVIHVLVVWGLSYLLSEDLGGLTRPVCCCPLSTPSFHPASVRLTVHYKINFSPQRCPLRREPILLSIPPFSYFISHHLFCLSACLPAQPLDNYFLSQPPHSLRWL